MRLSYRAYGEKGPRHDHNYIPHKIHDQPRRNTEKWYLEHDDGEIIYLRKTPRPKWNCGMKEFPAAKVFPDYKTARTALKARSNAK